MRTPRVVVAGVVAAACLPPFRSYADDAGWRDGWCAEGEGISVVVDWHLAPPALATPLVADGDQTHLVRCAVHGEAPVPSDARALLELVGLEHNPHGLIASVNGIALDGFEFSWHLRAGTEGRWTDSDWLVDPAVHVAMSYTVRDMDPALVEAPQPVLSPVYAPPPPTVPPSPDATPLPTGDPVEVPGDDPGPIPSTHPSRSGDPATQQPPGAPGTTPPAPAPSSSPSPTPTPSGSPTPSPSPSPSPSPTATRSTVPAHGPAPSPTPPSPTPTPTPTATPDVTPSLPLPVATPASTVAPGAVWGEEPVERGPSVTPVATPTGWPGGLIGGVFVAMASGGVVLARRWMRHEFETASRWDDE